MDTDEHGFSLRLERNAELTLIKFPRTLRNMAKKAAGKEVGRALRCPPPPARKGLRALPPN
jgi:hypothetical protein